MSGNIDDLLNEVAANTHKPEREGYVFDNEDELVGEINSKCRMIALGDETRFVIRDDQGVPRFLRRRDAETELAQYQLLVEVQEDEGKQGAENENKKKRGKKKTKILSGFAIWLKSADRLAKYERRVFNPSESEVGANDLNMWTNFAVDPAPGDWSLLRGHIRDNICKGNEEHFHYLMGWMAQLFQDPGKKIGVAVALRGPKGCGKSKLSDWIRHIIGPRHAMVADKKDQWTGKFTEQLRLIVFLACEEALFAGNHEQDSSMKHLISNEDFSYEAKGKDIIGGKNYTRVFVTANEEWTVPATPGERRFFVLDVGTKRAKDTKFFAAIDEQMNTGGAAAMLYDLLSIDYGAIDLRNPPMTDALKDQIEIGLKANLAWLASALAEGEFPFLDRARPSVEWPDELVSAPGKEPTKQEMEAHEAKRYVLKSEVQDSFRDFVIGHRDRPITDSAVGKFLTKHVPGVEGVKKRVFGKLTPHYCLPWLSDARSAFLKANPGVTFAEPDKVHEDRKNEPEAERACSSAVTPLAEYRHRARY